MKIEILISNFHYKNTRSRDRDFLLWARAKNLENPEIPKKSREKNPENPGDRDIKTSKKSRKNPECYIPKIPKSRGSGWGFEDPE